MMIDWTDRSEDVLVRFEIWRNADFPNDCLSLTERLSEMQLITDLATMTDLASQMAAPGSQTGEDVRGYIMANAIDNETGERLFPDPKD